MKNCILIYDVHVYQNNPEKTFLYDLCRIMLELQEEEKLSKFNIHASEFEIGTAAVLGLNMSLSLQNISSLFQLVLRSFRYFNSVVIKSLRNFNSVVIKSLRNFNRVVIKSLRNLNSVLIKFLRNFNSVVIKSLRNFNSVVY